jgi:hypothetical protein
MPTQIEALSPSAGWEEVRQLAQARAQRPCSHRRATLSVEALRALSERACAQLVRAVDLQEVQGTRLLLADPRRIRCSRHRQATSGLRRAGGAPRHSPKIGSRRVLELEPRHADAEGSLGYPDAQRARRADARCGPRTPWSASTNHGFRLGYGGGYFDRTLAAAARRPFAIGLGYPKSRACRRFTLSPTTFPWI